MISANAPAMGAIERGKKAADNAAKAHDMPKILAFKSVRSNLSMLVFFNAMLAGVGFVDYVSPKIKSENQY